MGEKIQEIHNTFKKNFNTFDKFLRNLKFHLINYVKMLILNNYFKPLMNFEN